eukprot:1165805-Lingulodinium_polyedra.AAC.1
MPHPSTTAGHSPRIGPDGRWMCAVCQRSAGGMRDLASRPCSRLPGVRLAVHASHRCLDSSGVVWCRQCG